MKSKRLSAVLALACVAVAWLPGSSLLAAPVTVKSAYLKDPSKNLERLTQLADFFVRSKDTVNGGFYSFVDRDGAPTYPPYTWWHQKWPCGDNFDFHLKSVAAHARVAYLYTRAFMVTGNEDYLTHARHALDFMYEHGWDEQRQGWWFTLNEQGNVAPWIPCEWWDPNKWKWTYAQMYPLIGITAYVEATQSAIDRSWLEQGLRTLDTKLWDAGENRQGYFTDADLDWSKPRGKGFTPSVDGITTHALAAHLLTGAPAATARLLALADGIVTHLIPSMDEPAVLFGFPEQFDADWKRDSTITTGSVGHLLKTAWVLDRAYLVEPKPSYREGAQRILDEVLGGGGYDFVNGGPFTNYDWSKGTIEQNKGYWELEQAVMLGLVHHHVAERAADRTAALRIADESLQFFHDHLWDTERGGHYFTTDAAGSVTDPTKSDVYEQGYHVSEMLYFAYLYGNLYLKQVPAQLFYHFEKADVDRTVRLNPIEITSADLRIRSVSIDGKPCHGFDAATRSLHIPAGVGGTFKVTFALDRARAPSPKHH